MPHRERLTRGGWHYLVTRDARGRIVGMEPDRCCATRARLEGPFDFPSENDRGAERYAWNDGFTLIVRPCARPA